MRNDGEAREEREKEEAEKRGREPETTSSRVRGPAGEGARRDNTRKFRAARGRESPRRGVATPACQTAPARLAVALGIST